MIDYESQHRLDFGGLDFTGVEDYEGARFYAMADGATLGNPVPVERSIETALLDGSFVVNESHGNREPAWQVWIEAPDSVALAYGEKLLFQQCARRVEMGWTPPDGWGPRTVYEAFTSSLTHQFDDMLEMRLVRSYLLRVVAAPFGYSEDEVTDVAADYVVTPVTTVMADGTSTTGWTADDGSVTTSGGVLQVPSHIDSGPATSNGADFYTHGAAAVYTFAAVNFTTARFLSADLDMVGCYAFVPYVSADGVLLRQVSRAILPSGLTRFTWTVNDSSVTSIRFSILGTSATTVGGTPASPVGRIDNVSRSNIGPAISTTGRQALRSVEVTGSARTAASVAVEHTTAGLGEALIYTSKELGAGYNPAMRQWMTSSGSTSVDATGVSGFTSTGGATFEVNAAALPPGPYLLMMRGSLAATANSKIAISVSSVIGSTVIRTTEIPTSVRPSGLALGIHALGMATLPVTDLPEESTGLVRITLNPTGTFALDELWAFYMGEDADLTHVKCGAGTPAAGAVHNRLFLDSPTIDNGGKPGLYVGTAADRSDAFFPADAPSWGRHPFVPPSAALFVVTTGAAYPSVTLRHRPAWHTHAGQ